jgi:hypothetical protein
MNGFLTCGTLTTSSGLGLAGRLASWAGSMLSGIGPAIVLSSKPCYDTSALCGGGQAE